MSVKILVDSAADISQAEAKELGISLIPLKVYFGEEEYYDGVDLLPDQFFNKLIESDVLPKTSQITPFRFEEEYDILTKDGDELVVITLSSKLSGTYQSAVQAAEGYKDKVFVVDSQNATVGERLVAEYAIRLANEGKSASEIADILNKSKKKVKLLALLNTLEYLKKGGRISSAVAFAGELISLKPVVSIIDGEVKLVGKALGSKRGNNLLTTLVEKTSGIDFSMPFGVVKSGTDSTLLNKYVKDSAHLWQNDADSVPAHDIGSTIGTHVGPGAIGVAFFEK